MSVAKTSIEAYVAVLPSLGEKMDEILQVYEKRGKCSRNEVQDILKAKYENNGHWAFQVSARTKDLINAGKVTVCDYQIDPKTHRRVEVLCATGKFPAIKKKSSIKERLIAAQKAAAVWKRAAKKYRKEVKSLKLLIKVVN